MPKEYADSNIVGVEGLSESGEWERNEILRPAPFRHPAYEWEDGEGFWIGRWKGGAAAWFLRESQI
jgi:hypothetical protein